MPLKNHVDIAKQLSAEHVNFPIAPLLGRCPVIAQRSGNVILFHVLFQRYRCECCPGPKQVMSTTVAWRVCYHGATVRRGGLRKAGERVKFA